MGESRRAPLVRQGAEPLEPLAPLGLFMGDAVMKKQCVVHLLCVAGLGPCFFSHALDRSLVEGRQVGGPARVEPSPRHDGLCPSLFERRIVEEGVGVRVQHRLRERGWLGQVARKHVDFAGLHPREQRLEAFNVHGFMEAVFDGLLHEWVIGDVTVAGHVLETRDLIWKAQGKQVVRLHALELRRNFLAAAKSKKSECAGSIPAPARLKHRSIEHRLHENLSGVLGAQKSKHVFERKAVRRAERQDDRVLDGGGLKLYVEAPAESLAKRQTPCSIDARSERCVDDDVHRSRFVEKAFDHHRIAGRHGVEGDAGTHQVLGELLSGQFRNGGLVLQPCDHCVRVLVQGVDPFANCVHGLRKEVGACRRFPKPEWQCRWCAFRIRNTNDARLDAEDSIRVVSKLKNVTRRAFECQVLVHAADSQPLRFQPNFVVEVVWNRAAIGDRRESGASSRADATVDLVAMKIGSPSATARGKAL